MSIILKEKMCKGITGKWKQNKNIGSILKDKSKESIYIIQIIVVLKPFRTRKMKVRFKTIHVDPCENT